LATFEPAGRFVSANLMILVTMVQLYAPLRADKNQLYSARKFYNTSYYIYIYNMSSEQQD